jgi:hypothetical protein
VLKGYHLRSVDIVVLPEPVCHSIQGQQRILGTFQDQQIGLYLTVLSAASREKTTANEKSIINEVILFIRFTPFFE